MGILDFIMRFKPNSKKLGVLMLGLDNSGKSSILHQLSSEEDITHITPTQGFRIKSLVAHGVKLNVWDVGGQRSMRSYWRQYFDETDVLIFVVDSADHERMVEASEEFSFLLEEEKTAGIPILVFANKQDLPEAMQAREVAEVLQLDALRDRAWHIQACSAKTFEGVAEGMEWIVKQMRPKASLGQPKDLPPNGKTAASSA